VHLPADFLPDCLQFEYSGGRLAPNRDRSAGDKLTGCRPLASRTLASFIIHDWGWQGEYL
jgi:hypothetical protein